MILTLIPTDQQNRQTGSPIEKHCTYLSGHLKVSWKHEIKMCEWQEKLNMLAILSYEAQLLYVTAQFSDNNTSCSFSSISVSIYWRIKTQRPTLIMLLLSSNNILTSVICVKKCQKDKLQKKMEDGRKMDVRFL